MNRPIKFRAWDEVNKCMVYDFRTFTDKKIVTDEHRWSWSLKTRNNNQIVATLNRYDFLTGSGFTHEHAQMPLMQYTGLKDKNGVEIYEGDIFFDDHNEEFGQVTFEEGKFLYEATTFVTDLFEIADALDNRGNIYETPDLLGETDE